MSVFTSLAKDIINNPDKWQYEDYYLTRNIGLQENSLRVKITCLCNKPYVLLLGKFSDKPGLWGRFQLAKAVRTWLRFQYAILEEGLEEAIPMADWIKRREDQIAKRKPI